MIYNIQKKPLKLSVNKFKNMNDEDILSDANVTVKDENGNDVTNQVKIDRSVINLHEYKQTQQLPLLIKTSRQSSIQVGYIDLTLVRVYGYLKYLILFFIIFLIIVGIIMFHQHRLNNQNQAIQSQQSSQINQQSSQISQQGNQINNDLHTINLLKQQIQILKQAVQQYQQTQNKQQFDNQINSIKQQLQNVQNNNQKLRGIINELEQALTELSNCSPQQVTQALNKYHFNF